MFKSRINPKESSRIINYLKKLDGAINYDGDYSEQVYFELKNGQRLRFGQNDEGDGLFVDQYAGLAIIGANGIPKKI